MRERSGLSLRRIDIREWGSAVAEQHGIRRLPHLLLYDASGKLLADGAREVLAALLQPAPR